MSNGKKLKIKDFLLTLLIVTTISSLVSCQRNADGVQLATPLPIRALSPTPTSSTHTTASPTPRYFRNKTDCVLPCYNGITPGVTKISEAQSFLEDNIKTTVKKAGDVVWYGHSIREQYTMVESGRPANFMFDLDFRVDHNGTVQQIFIWFITHGNAHIPKEYWTQHSPRNIFLQIGVPDAIYSIKNSGALALVYTELGVVGVYDALWNGKSLCPEDQSYLSNMSFMLSNTAFSSDIYPFNGEVIRYPSLWLPIEQVLNISVKQFYNSVLNTPSVCFPNQN